MSKVFKTDDKLKSYFRPGDLFLLDRGFRGVIPELGHMNYETLMQAFLEKGQKQLSDIQAKKSRFCTKVRGIVGSFRLTTTTLSILGQSSFTSHTQTRF